MMSTIQFATNCWNLSTHGDPLGAVRGFLEQIWSVAGLEGMLVNYPGEAAELTPYLVEAPAQLAAADPFAPLMLVNSAGIVTRLARQRPQARLGAVLRSCEARALHSTARRAGLELGNWLTVGVDCLACFPAEEVEWRTQKAGTADQLTRESLRFARQGGIAAYRYRPACQMCALPEAQDADLTIGVLGLPAREAALVIARDEATAERLRLSRLTAGPAPAALVAQRERLLSTLNRRRMRLRERAIRDLPAHLPRDVDGLIALLDSCAPCRRCLEACALYAGELEWRGEGARREAVRRWLVECVACGLCDQVCPEHRPLTAIVARVMSGAARPAGGAYALANAD